MSLQEFKDGHVWLNHRDTFVLLGKIEFDNKYEKFATGFGLNPLRKAAPISGKVSNLDVKAIQNMKNFDETILQIVNKTGPPSYRRNAIPLTENQNFGWSAGAMKYDKSKIMLHYGRRRELFYK